MVCLRSNAQTAVTDCLVYTGPRENRSGDGNGEASRSLWEQEKFCILLSLTFAFKTIPSAPLTRCRSFTITVVSTVWRGKVKEKSSDGNVAPLQQRELPLDTQGCTKKGPWARGCCEELP